MNTDAVKTALLLKLKSPRQSGQQIYAQCPFHDDKTASFSANLEKMVWTCHAGCEGDGKISTLLDRLGMKIEWRPALEEEKVYDYRDEKGNLVFQVIRYKPKTFKQRRADGAWNLDGIRKVPYRLQEILGAKTGSGVFLVEGEKDADGLVQIGLCATTTAGGASSWRDDYAQYFKDKVVFILPDNDEPGKNYALQAAGSLEGKAKTVRIIELPNLPAKGDVSDWLAAGGNKKKLVEICRVALNRPQEVPLPEDRVVSSFEKRREVELNPKHQFSAKTGFPELDRLVGGLRGGEMVIVSGKVKNGKTLLLQTMTRKLAAQGVNSLWFSYEVNIHQFLEQMPKDLAFWIPNQLTTNAMEWIKAKIVEAKEKFGVRVVNIDHLHYLVDMERVRNPAFELGALVRSLKRMAIDLDVIIFLISHVRKVPKGIEAGEDDLRDTGFTIAEADTTWIVSRLTDKAGEALDFAKVRVCNHRRTGTMGKYVGMAYTPNGFEECLLPTEEKPLKQVEIKPNWQDRGE